MNYYYPPPYGEQSQPQAQTGYYQLASDDYQLRIRQQPRDALLAQDGREKSRKAVDPAPFVEVKVREGADPIQQYLQSPYLFMTCNLVSADLQYPDPAAVDEKGLCGTTTTSLHKLKDTDNKDGGFFVFADLSVKRAGEHKLMFSLYELQKETLEVVFHRSILSDTFVAHPQKEYPGLEQSTSLSRLFFDQGVKLRLKKESRSQGGGSGRKRSWAASQAEQTSAAASSGRTATSGPSSGSAYAQSRGSPATRQRLDDGSFSGYPLPSRPMATHDPSSSYNGLPDPYASPGAASRLQPQSHATQQPGRQQPRWSMYEGGTGNGQPATDFSFRTPTASLPRLDPSLAAPQGPGMLPQGTVSQSQPGHAGGVPHAASHYQQPQYAYGQLPLQHSQQQYRADGTYPPHSQMYPTEQYGDPTQPSYPGSYDSSRPSNYQGSSSRGWGS